MITNCAREALPGQASGSLIGGKEDSGRGGSEQNGGWGGWVRLPPAQPLRSSLLIND